MKKPRDDVTKEQLIADFKVVINDAEALLRATANHGGDELVALRAKAEESLRQVQARMAAAQAALLVTTKEAAETADVYIHDNPWQAIGVAAGFGVLIGLLLARR